MGSAGSIISTFLSNPLLWSGIALLVAKFMPEIGELVKKFLKNIAFLDSKRPFSKKVLKRIDIKKCLNLLSLNDLKVTENELELSDYVTQEKLMKYEELF